MSAVRYAVVGPGAIGCAVAASLLERGLPVSLHGRSAPQFGGARSITVTDALAGAAHTFEVPDLEAGPADVVFFATKAHQSAGAAHHLRGLVTPDTVIVVLQNGVEHVERLTPLLPAPCLVLPAVVALPANRTGDGLVTLRRPGAVLLPDREDARALTEPLRRGGGQIPITFDHAADFKTAMWRKLAVNVISGAIPTLTDQSGPVFAHPPITALCRAIVRECVAVARCEGARLSEDDVEAIIEGFAASRGGVTSMLQDRRAGRQLEAEARNGAVVRIGARHGVSTPLNRAVTALLGVVNVDLMGE